MKLDLNNEAVELLPEKAFYWAQENILAFADVHIGKAESLQKLGIPMPTGPHLEDLARIDRMIKKTRAKRIFMLGDFIHSRTSD